MLFYASGVTSCILFARVCPIEPFVSRGRVSSWLPTDRHVAGVSEEAKITIETEEYVNSFTASMMEATFAWSNGANFSEVCAPRGYFVPTCNRLKAYLAVGDSNRCPARTNQYGT